MRIKKRLVFVSKLEQEQKILKNKLKAYYAEIQRLKLKNSFNSWVETIGGIDELKRVFPVMQSCQDLMIYAGYSRIFAYTKSREIYLGIKKGGKK